MSAQVKPMFDSHAHHMRTLARDEERYVVAREKHADALTSQGLAIVLNKLTAAHKHAVETAAQELHEAQIERDASVAVLLREWVKR